MKTKKPPRRPFSHRNMVKARSKLAGLQVLVWKMDPEHEGDDPWKEVGRFRVAHGELFEHYEMPEAAYEGLRRQVNAWKQDRSRPAEGKFFASGRQWKWRIIQKEGA